MAESYRGLTIRIGGDTTKLQQALRTSNSAISGTQSELRKLGQALKLDPGNIEAYNLQVGFLANQAANTAMKLSQMQEAVKQVGERKISLADGDETTVSELARATEEFSGDVENAALKAAQARAEFNQLVATLGTMHNEVTELSSKLASLESDKFSKAFDLSVGKKSVAEIREELAKAFQGISTEDLEKRIQEIQELSKTFDFDNVFDLSEGTVNVEEITRALSKIPESIRPGEESVQEFIANIEAMNEKYAESRAELARIAEEREKALGANDDKFAEELGTRFARLGQQYREAMDGIEDETEQAKVADKFTEKFQNAFMRLESSSNSSADKIGRKYDAQLDSALKKSNEVLDSIRSEYGTARDELTSLTGTVFNFASGNTDPNEMKTALDDMRASLEGMADELGLNQNEIESFIKNVESLQSKFRDADSELKKWNLVQEFQDLVVEYVKGEATISQMSRAMADMKEPSNLMRGMNELVESSKVLEQSYKTLMSTGSSLADTLTLNPSDSEAATQAMNAYSAAELIAVENANKLQQQLSSFDASRIDAVTDYTKSATKQLLDAEKAAQDASAEYAKAQGNVERLNYIIDILGGKADEVLGNVGEAAFANLKNAADITTLEEARQELAKYESDVARLGQARREAFANLELSKERSEYEKAKAGVEQWTSAILEARNAQIELTKQSAVSESFGDTSDIDQLGQQLETAVKHANVLKTLLEHDPTNMEIASQKMQAFADVTSIAEKRTEAINSRLSKIDTSRIDKMRESYGTAANAMTQTEKAASDLSRNVEVARQKLNTLTSGKLFDGIRDEIRDTSKDVGITLPTNIRQAREELIRLEKAFEDALSDVHDASVLSFFEELKAKIVDTAKEAESVNWAPQLDEAAFQQAVTRVAQLAKEAGQEIVQSANTIDSAYRDMRKTVNETESNFEALRDQAIKFSQTHVTSSDTILEMEALGGQLGIASSALAEFGEVASNLDIATDIQAEDIALQLGQIKNVMSDMDDTTFTNFADALVRLGNTTATTESNIMNVAQRMSSVANVTSMTTPQLLAWSAAIASTGQRSESAATAINNTITGIGKAVAAGGDTLEQFAAIAGMTADEFREAWENSSSDALEAFVKGLGALTDDSTAAIEALDSVGISSVRQETALLGLSQTVENLDEAMNNATDAWNGGGDAAREAAQKSEGFSGALGILENNASNLAASLGDGMIPFMKALSGILAVVTDALNALPGPLKTTVVEMGALAIAAGTVSATLKGLGIDGVISALTSLIVSEGAATVATNALTAALEAVPVIGWIAGAITALNMLGGQLADAAEHTKMLSEATDGLRNAHALLEESYSAESNVSKSLADIKSEHEAALQSVADFGEKMRDTWSNLGTDAAMADTYAQTIRELGSQGSLTSGEIQELKNAVEQYNSITGSSISIINEQTGELNIQTSAIDEVTKAYKRQAEAQAYAELYNEAIKEQIKNQETLTQKTEELDEMTAKYGVELGNGYTFMLWNVNEARELESTISDLTKTDEELSNVIDDYSSHLSDSANELSDYGTALVSAGMDTSEFSSLTDEEKRKLNEIQAALAAVGDSLTNYGSLNASQLSQIAAAWNGKTSEIVAAINKIKSAASDANGAASSVKPDDSAVREYRNQQDAAYTQAKRDLDDYYSYEKKIRDDAYDSEKSRLDKEYQAHKDTLDKEYSARKSELDKEYSEAKKASDKYLKDYKAALDQQVSDHKAVTEAKLKDVEREYDAKNKLLELEYKSYDEDLSGRIQAIKDEQAAEDEAYKQQERQEKLAELGKAVETARTNKARKDAEKALSDYKAQLAREDVKAQRDAQIDALEQQRSNLKDQLSDRQSHLKDSYDSAVAEYKAEREAELELLKSANEAKYEQEKELETSKLEMRKSANEATLQMIKDSNEAELASHKESNENYLNGLKDRNEAELLAIKRANEDKLTELKNQQERELAAYKEGGQAAVDALNGVKDEAEAASESVRTSMSDMQESTTRSVEEIAKALYENGQISLQTYLGIMNQMPGSMQSIFDEMGLTVDTGLGEVAKRMLESGDISLQQYLGVMNQMPGSTRFICNETGIAIADELGLFNEPVANAAENLKGSVTGPMSTLPQEVKGKSDEAGNAASSLGGQEAVNNASKNSGNLAEALFNPWTNIDKDAETVGSNFPLALTNGINRDSDKPVAAAATVRDETAKTLDMSDSTQKLGGNAAIGWNNGFVEWANKALENVQRWAQSIVSTVQSTHQVHSPSRKFAWLAEMALKGYSQGWDLAEGGTLRMVQRTSDDIVDSFGDQGLSTDFMQDLLDQMRGYEGELKTQATRMRQVIEDAFDPRLSIEAAYEAMEKISNGELKRQQTIAASSTQNNDNRQFQITISIPEVVVREEADIDRLSQQIALRVQRSVNARIG